MILLNKLRKLCVQKSLLSSTGLSSTESCFIWASAHQMCFVFLNMDKVRNSLILKGIFLPCTYTVYHLFRFYKTNGTNDPYDEKKPIHIDLVLPLILKRLGHTVGQKDNILVIRGLNERLTSCPFQQWQP